MNLEGFVRPSGQAGARNYVFIVPSVVCSTVLSRQIADAVGAVTVSHQHGCGHIGPDIVQARDLFAGLATNPNVGRSMIASLGCETVQGKHIAAELERRGHSAALVGIQDSGGHDPALAAGIEQAQPLVAEVGQIGRSSVGFEAITLGITASRTDARIGQLIDAATIAGARVVIAADPQVVATIPDGIDTIAVGEPATAPVSQVTRAGAGAQLLAAVASCGAALIVDFPAEGQPPQGLAVAPVLSVAGDGEFHAMIAGDFDTDADADAPAILAQVAEVFSGSTVRAEGRGATAFAIPRLLRTM